MDNQYKLLTDALKVFKDFSHSNIDWEFEYDLDNPAYNLLKDKYSI